MKKKIFTLLLVAIAAIGIAACGSSSSDTTSADTSAGSTPATTGGGGGPAPLKVTAASDGSLSWSPTKLTAKSGKVTIELANSSSTPHNIQIQGQGDESDTISGGETADITANLKPGTYTYFCDIPGHRQAGMVGTLVVK